MWRPILIDVRDIPPVAYHDHDMLDCVPKKSVSEQVAMFIEAGARLEESHLAMLNRMDVGDDEDLDDADTGIDEYSGYGDIVDAADALISKAGARPPATDASSAASGASTPSSAAGGNPASDNSAQTGVSPQAAAPASGAQA